MRVRLSSEAKQDLTAIGDYIARDNPARARFFVKELIDGCADLARRPLSCPLVPRYEAKGIRRCVHGNYQIFYRANGEQIQVARILHGARDHEALL
ncbi:type II toxin-antitoxin system RelE/ParE family toxin [Inquilinus sp.]|uniref:type II toxin-antitoxin system RelE/ParE family toxin n=1 Tax=Inquilinus sp. TaxID=1932117 RepID=UPI0037832395